MFNVEYIISFKRTAQFPARYTNIYFYVFDYDAILGICKRKFILSQKILY